MSKYLIASPEGAQHFGHQEGEEVELELAPDRELAYVCAGWLEKAEKKEKK